jgi:hypothetical protein
LFIIAALATTNIQTANAQIWSFTGKSGIAVNTNFIGTKTRPLFIDVKRIDSKKMILTQ